MHHLDILKCWASTTFARFSETKGLAQTPKDEDSQPQIICDQMFIVSDYQQEAEDL